MNMYESAAHALVGRKLANGWIVEEQIQTTQQSTGGFFSVCYLVKREGQKAFLKALNIFAFVQLNGGKGKRFVDIVNQLTEAFIFERDLLMLCKDKNLSKVSLILDEGEEYIEGYSMPNVPYLIFELADGDVRKKLTFSDNVEIAWKLRSLHNVAVGIKQLHALDISHQDLKPSNVLLFQNKVSKIGDLGRSICKMIDAPHDSDGDGFVGDTNYAPPEYLYGFNEPNWTKRAYTVDAYLLGSMIIFYFTGLNMTALISRNLEPEFHWANWYDSFENVLPYLGVAYQNSLEQFASEISDIELRSELKNMVADLCYFDPSRRGKIQTGLGKNQLRLLETYISSLDRLAKKAQWKLSFS